MPYFYRKIRGKDLYKVFNKETGEVHAKETTLDKAKAQIRLLETPVQDLAGNFVNITYDIKEVPKKRGRPKKGGALGQVLDLVMNPIKEIKKEIQFYTNLVTGRKDYSPAVKKILGEYGDLVIEEATLYRKPLSSALTASINVVSLGEFYKNLNKTPYEKLFHLCIYLKTNKGIVSLEKEEVIVMKKGMFPRKDAELEPVTKLPQGLTINKALEQTKNRMGDKFFTYSASSNNCQDFILAFLQANNMGSEEDYTFVKQNTEQLFKNLPILRKIADAVTGVAARADVIRQGAGTKEKKKEKKKPATMLEELRKRERGQSNRMREIGEAVALEQLRKTTSPTPQPSPSQQPPDDDEGQDPPPPPAPKRPRRSPPAGSPASKQTLNFTGRGSFFSRPTPTTPPTTPRAEPQPLQRRYVEGSREERANERTAVMNRRREERLAAAREENERFNERIRVLRRQIEERMRPQLIKEAKDPKRGAGPSQPEVPPPPLRRRIGFSNSDREERDEQVANLMRLREERLRQAILIEERLRDAQTNQRIMMTNRQFNEERIRRQQQRREPLPKRGMGIVMGRPNQVIPIQDAITTTNRIPNISYRDLRPYADLVRRSSTKREIIDILDDMFDNEEFLSVFEELQLYTYLGNQLGIFIPPDLRDDDSEMYAIMRTEILRNRDIPEQTVRELTVEVLSQPIITLAELSPMAEARIEGSGVYRKIRMGGLIVTPPGTPPPNYPFNFINENTDLDISYDFFNLLVNRWNNSNQSAAMIANLNDTYNAFVDFNPEIQYNPNTNGVILMRDILHFISNLVVGEEFDMPPPEEYDIPANIVTRPNTPPEFQGLQGLGIKKKSPSTIKAMSKPNRWIEYVKSYAEKNGINYREALRDPNLKAGYKKGSGATHSHPDGTVMTGATMTSKSKVIKKGTGMPSNQEAVIAESYNEKFLGANTRGM